MDSVFSWFVLVVLTNVGLILAVKKYEDEKAQDNADNDAFFREYDKKFK